MTAPPREHLWNPHNDPEEPGPWERCSRCKLQRMARRDAQAGGLFLFSLRNWRLKVAGNVCWSNTVPACRRGEWSMKQLESGDVPEQLEAGE